MGDESGIVFDVERFAIHDGPGIRTTVFFKGCPLSCAWCQNPESMSARPELLFHEHLCVSCGRCVEACESGAHVIEGRTHAFRRELCRACGACADGCPTHALELAGRWVTVAEVMEEVLRDRAFYERSGGGMTLSGGEPMAQPDFARALLEAARREGLRTALDTSGCAPWPAYEEMLPLVDLFLFDLKDTDAARCREYTGADLEAVLANLGRLDAAGARIRLRCVVVPGVNDTPAHREAVERIAAPLAALEGIDYLPYHSLGLAKWRALGRVGRDFSA